MLTPVGDSKGFKNVDTGWDSGDNRDDVGREDGNKVSKVTLSMLGLLSRISRDDIFNMTEINIIYTYYIYL